MANLYKRAVPHLHYFSSDITRSFKAMDCVILYRIDEIYSILSDVFLTFSSKDVQNCSTFSGILITRKKKECMTATKCGNQHLILNLINRWRCFLFCLGSAFVLRIRFSANVEPTSKNLNHAKYAKSKLIPPLSVERQNKIYKAVIDLKLRQS